MLKIVHAAYIPPDQFQEAQSTKIDNKEFMSMISNSKFDLLDPTKVLSLFRRINQEVSILFYLIFLKFTSGFYFAYGQE